MIRQLGGTLHSLRWGSKATFVASLSLAFALGGCTDTRLADSSPPPAIQHDLVLDADSPLIAVTVAGVALRLRVDPGQWDAIELNTDAARRIGLSWQGPRDIQIGRITLPGRWATTTLAVQGRKLPVIVAEHGRTAVAEADGIVGPDILPFATIAWRNPTAARPTDSLDLPLVLDGPTGLTATPPELPLPLRLRFSLIRARSEATAAAGSMLAQRYGGRFEGEEAPLPVLFGIGRPARTLRFDRAPLLAGFRIPGIAVRIADFRGDNPLPTDPVGADEIIVAGKDYPQPARAWVTLAHDWLSGCSEILYRAVPRTLTLRCAFDR